MKHHLCVTEKQCIVQSAWRFQINIENWQLKYLETGPFLIDLKLLATLLKCRHFRFMLPHPLGKLLSVESDYVFITHLYYLMLFSIKRLLFRLCWLGNCWSGLHLVLGWHFELALKSEKLKNCFSNLGVLNGGEGFRWKLWYSERGPLPFKWWDHTEIVESLLLLLYIFLSHW